MKNFPNGGLIGRTVHTFRHIASLRVSLYAANASFFILLALFPALLLLLSVLRFTPLGVKHMTQLLSGMLPAAFAEDIGALLSFADHRSSSAVLGLSAITGLWSASRGIYGMLTGLNAIYQVEEHRGYWKRRLLSTGFTLAFLLILLLTLALHVFAGELIAFARQTFQPLTQFLLGVLDLRFYCLLILQTLVFSAMFMFLPGRKNSLRKSLPGALLASCGWLVFSNLFSIYVEHFANVRLYGPVSSLALGLLWLYCCISIVFYGAVLNVLLEKRK